MAAPVHWAITNGPDGNDANSGVYAGDMSNAVKTWQELWDKIEASLVGADFTENQIVHVGNHSPIVLSTGIVAPNGNTTWDTAWTQGVADMHITAFEEGTTGLYHTIGGVPVPCWEVDCTTPGDIFTDSNAEPRYLTWSFGRIIGMSANAGLSIGTYNRFFYCYFDFSLMDGNFDVLDGVTHLENCWLKGGDGVSSGSAYGVGGPSGGVVVRNNLFTDFKGSAITLKGGIVENNVFVNNCTNVLTRGIIYVTSPDTNIIRNNTFIGQGVAGGDVGIWSNDDGSVTAANNIFHSIETPLFVDVGDGYILSVEVNGFYNCGNTTVVKDDPTVGFGAGIAYPGREGAVILAQDPFVDAASGDYRLTPRSEARGKGRGPGLGWPGMPGASPTAVDLGAFPYGVPNLPLAPGFVG